MEKEKKPIYKKWWFWLIVIIVIGAIGASDSTENTSSTSNNSIITSSIVNETNTDKMEKMSTVENQNTNTQTDNNSTIPSENESNTEKNENVTNENQKSANTPTDIELMSYAQLVLDDNLNNPKYSRLTSDYTFIGTGLRYKIEGKVNNENFWMIIQFTDSTYEYYDLISLQVGTNLIYKK